MGKITYVQDKCFHCEKPMMAPLRLVYTPLCKKCINDIVAANMKNGDYVSNYKVFFDCRQCEKSISSSKRRFMWTQFCVSCEREWIKEHRRRDV